MKYIQFANSESTILPTLIINRVELKSTKSKSFLVEVKEVQKTGRCGSDQGKKLDPDPDTSVLKISHLFYDDF